MKKFGIIVMILICLVLLLTGCNKKKIEDLETRLATAEASLSAVTREKADSDSALKALSAEKDALLAEADENLKKVTEEKNAQIAEAEKNLKEMTDEKNVQLAEAQEDLRILEERSAMLLSQADDTLKSTIDSINEKLTAVEEESSKTIAEKDARITQLEADLSAVRQEKTDMETNLTAVIAEKDEKLAEAEAALNGVTKEKNDQIAAATSALAQTTEEKNARINELEEALAAASDEMNKKIQEAEDALNAVTKDKNDKLSAVQSALDTLSEEKNQLAAEAEAALAQVIEEKDSKIAEVESALSALKKEKDELLTEAEAALHALSLEKNEKIAELETKLQTVTSEKDQLVTEYEAKLASALSDAKELVAAEIGNFMQGIFPIDGETDAEKSEDGNKETEDSETITLRNNTEDEPENSGLDFQGTWYVSETCLNNVCIDPGDLGFVYEYTFNVDHTLTTVSRNLKGDVEEVQYEWGVIDGVLTASAENESPASFVMNENGELIGRSGSGMITLVRQAPAAVSIGSLDTNAAPEYFIGGWQLDGLYLGDSYFPVKGFGVNGSLIINEDTIDFAISDLKGSDLPYEFSDGLIHFTINNTKIEVESRGNDMLEVLNVSEGEEGIPYIFVRTK